MFAACCNFAESQAFFLTGSSWRMPSGTFETVWFCQRKAVLHQSLEQHLKGTDSDVFWNRPGAKTARGCSRTTSSSFVNLIVGRWSCTSQVRDARSVFHWIRSCCLGGKEEKACQISSWASNQEVNTCHISTKGGQGGQKNTKSCSLTPFQLSDFEPDVSKHKMHSIPITIHSEPQWSLWVVDWYLCLVEK